MNETIIVKAKNALEVLDPSNVTATPEERRGAHSFIKELVLLIVDNE